MLREFKKFLMRGNVLDLAIAVIIGGAFGAVVKSLVDDILMPPIGKLLGGVNFSDLFINLGPGTYKSLAEAQAAGAATINYGLFINVVITFIIVAFVVFLIIKQVERLRPKEEPPAPEPATKKCPECLSDIPKDARRCAHCTSVVQ